MYPRCPRRQKKAQKNSIQKRWPTLPAFIIWHIETDIRYCIGLNDVAVSGKPVTYFTIQRQVQTDEESPVLNHHPQRDEKHVFLLENTQYSPTRFKVPYPKLHCKSM